MNKQVEALRQALAQQRTYERENWPFVDSHNKPTGSGESITYHLASLYDWSPTYVFNLPPEQRDERLREIWRSFSIAGDIIHRYELAAMALLESASFTDDAPSYQAMEAALQLLTANILNLRTELLVIKAAVVKGSEDERHVNA